MPKTLFYMTFSFAFNGYIQEKEDENMELMTWIFTICGAATLARGVMAVIDALEKE